MSELPYVRPAPPKLDRIVSALFKPGSLDNLSRRLEQIRQLRSVRVNELSDKSGLGRSTVYHYLADRNGRIPIHALIKILDILGYEVVVIPRINPRAGKNDGLRRTKTRRR